MRPLPSLLLAFSLGLTALAASPPARAQAQLSEADRKAAARSAYLEGVKLQEDGKPAEALSRFEAAQKLFDAPTHLLRIAQCQRDTGKLVEAAETYEVLIRKNLGASPPEAFSDAQKRGEVELKELRARIPTLRITVKPDPATLKNLQISLNGAPMPNELIGIARPVNPGTYKLNAGAQGYKLNGPIDVALAEREQKAQELLLVPGQPAVAVVPAPAPVPPAYTTQPPPPGPPPPYQPQPGPEPQPAPQRKPGSSAYGLLLGLHLGAVVPVGGAGAVRTAPAAESTNSFSMSDLATAGAGGGLDASFRFARILFVGGVFDYASLGRPEKAARAVLQTDDVSSHTTYVGLLFGIVPNIDKTSFIGSVGVGSRSFTTKSNNPAPTRRNAASLSGAELAVDLGLSIPAGPIRIIPKAALNVGAFSTGDLTIGSTTTSGDPKDKATHTFVFVGVGGLWNLDLGK